MMNFDRRQLLAMLPALALARPDSALTLAAPNEPFQKQLDMFWPLFMSLPNVREPARDADARDICFMFTNKSCSICKSVHRAYRSGFAKLEMRFVVYPWPGDDNRELNYLYRRETSFADLDAYMMGKPVPLTASNSPDLPDQILMAGRHIAEELIEGGGFGTPFFLYAAGAATNGPVTYTAGDIGAVQDMFDKAV